MDVYKKWTSENNTGFLKIIEMLEWYSLFDGEIESSPKVKIQFNNDEWLTFVKSLKMSSSLAPTNSYY